jgi:hypothetical protein
LLDSYSQYTDVLQRIAYKYKLARVLISGSAAQYAPWSEVKGQELVQAISRALIAKGFGVVSGFGLGIGPYVLNGVLQELDNEGTRLLDDRIILRPFPTAISDPAERKRRWTDYRKDMLTQAGVAIFLFGTKVAPSGTISFADGMEEEFRSAVAKRLFVVPVGCTGSVAESLHRKVLANFEDYYPLPGYRRQFASLATQGTPNQVALRVVNFVKKLWDDRGLSKVK